ncbi:MAG TPA: FAD-dependent oxidoreductase, partial [Planctomycetota bacterium]|nr:FAD-dependent oxidoreductase [Planctomycetota bacterium]
VRGWINGSNVQHAVVVGGGLIGLKAVEALVELGIKTTVVELADRILSATFDRTASDLALRFLERAGVHVHCGTTVSEVTCTGDRVVSAKLANGRELVCDLLIYAIGVVPDLAVTAGTGIAVDRGILVNRHQETSVAGIYAAGDVAQALDLLTGRSRPIPILPNACRQGYVAGACMAGRDVTYPGSVAMNAVDILGLPTISVGITTPEGDDCEVLTSGDEEAGTYRKLVLRDNRIIGAIYVGEIDRAGITTGLIRGKVDVSDFRELLLSRDFGVLSLPLEYRKHIVSGLGIEV